jgi:putative addiction module killer protein
VEAQQRNLKNYLSSNGRDRFHDWLVSINDQKARQAVRIRLNRVAEGNFGDWGPVGGGVHELRIMFGPGYRIYFGEEGDDVILLGGGTKSTQKSDIEIAKARWEDYNA